MAKVNAPLFSFNARGKLANALVYLSWKGLDTVRSYVVPTNPKTTKQMTQRGYFGDGVDAIHAAAPADVDKEAFGRAAALWANPRTWFNEAVKQWVDQKVASLIPAISATYENTTLAATQIESDITITPESSAITGVRCYYGTRKTYLGNFVDATNLLTVWTADITGLLASTKYFLQFVPTAPADFVGVYSGIYTETTPAT